METKNNSLNINRYHLLTTCYVPGIIRKIFMHSISFRLHYNTMKADAMFISIL